MSLHIGRVEIRNPTSIERTPSGLSLEGRVNRDPAAGITMQQLIGLGETAGETVAVWWDHNEIVDGFYRVGQPRWSASKGDGAFGNSFPWSLDLERVAGNPAIESHLIGGLRENDHSIVAATVEGGVASPFHAVPTDRDIYQWRDETASLAVERVSEDGAMAVFSGTADLGDPRLVEWLTRPDQFLVGAARLCDSDGNVIVGRSAAPASMGNGLLRVEVVGDESPITVRVAAFNGSTWGAWQSFVLFEGAAGSGFPVSSSAVVLRNTPQEVSAKWTILSGDLTFAEFEMSLRRGSYFAELYLRSTNYIGSLTVEVTGAGDDITGGIQRASNDTDGNRWLMMTPHAFTPTLTSPSLLTTDASVSSWQLALGVVVGGGSAEAADTAAELVLQYHAPHNENARFIQR